MVSPRAAMLTLYGDYVRSRWVEIGYRQPDQVLQAINEKRRFGFYKRIADLCLFVLGWDGS